MNISSVVIRAHPDKIDGVMLHLVSLPGVEIHGIADASRLAVTLEDTDVRTAADSFVALHEIPGVLTVTLIYQYDDADGKPTDSPDLFNNKFHSLHQEA